MTVRPILLVAIALTITLSGTSTKATAQSISTEEARAIAKEATIYGFPMVEYAANLAKEGSIGKLFHHREPAAIDNQTVIRTNRDTLYSSGVFDLDAGPVTITLPEAGMRFMSLQTISEDHYARTFYGTQPHTFTHENVGTRYLVVAIRTLVDPADPEDVKKVHALQDAIKVDQVGTGKFEIPNWDSVSQKKCARHCWCWARPCRISRTLSAPRSRLIRCGT